MNLPGQAVDRLEEMFNDATAKRKASSGDKEPDSAGNKAWKLELLNVLRVLAPTLGYCKKTPFGAWGAADWNYDTQGRIDLDKAMFWQDKTADGSMQVMAISVGTVTFGVGLGAFVPGQSDLDTFDLDEAGLAFLHEMRHMGTVNYGYGSDSFHGAGMDQSKREDQDGMNGRARAAEHMLNELEDYKVMFDHPWTWSMTPANLQRAHRDFRVGEDTERSCFAWQWMTNANGNGDSTWNGRSSSDDALPEPGARSDDGRAPAAHGSAHADPRQRVALRSAARILAEHAGLRRRDRPASSSTAERCAVALWANGNGWMQAKMLQALNPASFRDWDGSPHLTDADPWNVVGRWALGAPVRLYPHCYADANGPEENKQ